MVHTHLRDVEVVRAAEPVAQNVQLLLYVEPFDEPVGKFGAVGLILFLYGLLGSVQERALDEELRRRERNSLQLLCH